MPPQMLFLPLSRFVWYLQDFCRVPRGSRQILTGKCCSYPFPFCVVFAGLFQGTKGIPADLDPRSCSYPFPVCVVFAGLFQGTKGIPADLDPRSCSYPFPVCVVFAGLFQGAKGIPANFDRQMLFLPFPVLCGICRPCARCQGDPGKF